MKSMSRWMVYSFFFLTAALPGHAQSDSWLGLGSAWTNGSNWSLGRAPLTNEAAAFTNASPYVFAPTPTTTAVGRIDITGAASLTFNAGAFPITLHGLEGLGFHAGPDAGDVSLGTARFVLAADQAWRSESANVVTNNGTLTNGGFLLTLDGGGSGPLVFGASSVISGTGGLTVNRSGPGPVVLNSVNTYLGHTTLSNGTLKLGIANALPALTNSGNLMLSSPGQLDLNGFSQTVGALNGDGAVDNARNTGLVTLTVGYNNQPGSFSGSVGNSAGLVALTKAGTGVQVLANAALDYAGATTINLGLLRLGSPDVIPNGPGRSNLVVTTAGTCLFDLNGFSETVNSVTGAGIVTNSAGSATLSFGDADFTASSAIVFRDGGGLLRLSKIGSGAITLTGANTTRGGLVIQAGTLTVAVASTYLGPTLISNGVLKVGIANALPALTNSGNVMIEAPGLLDLNAFSSSAGALSGTGTIDNMRGAGLYTLTIGANNQSALFSGTIGNASGLVAIAKTGTGTQTLAGAGCTYAGATTVSGGMLKLGAPDVLPNGPGKSNLVVTTAGTCLFDLNGFDETVNGITGAGTVTNSAGQSTLTLGSGDGGSASTVAFRDGDGFLSVSKTGTNMTSLAGVLAIRGGLSVGNGILALGAANSLTGRTVVTGGALRLLNTTGSATGTGEVDIQNGGSLQGTGRVLGDCLLEDGARIQPGLPSGACGTLTLSNVTWQGGAVFDCDVTNLNANIFGSGVHYDQLTITGALTFVSGGKPLGIRLSSRGIPLPVDSTRNYALRVLTFGSTPSLSAADIALETNDFLAPGTWFVTNLNRSIIIYQQNVENANQWIGSGNWSSDTNWSLGRAPIAGDNVAFDWRSTAACTADSVSNNLASLTLDDGYAGTVTFSKNAVAGAMDLVLSGALTIRMGHLIFACDTLALGAGTPPVNYGAGYTVTVASVSIATNCSLNSDGMGFSLGLGPGGSYHNAAKGAPSHGGQGGGPDRSSGPFTVNLRPALYGTASGPTSLGSGYKAGAENDNNPGGGALKLNVTGNLTINGRLSCDGANRFVGKYPGAGGSLWITGGTLEGNGRISACGTIAGSAYGTAGGGRIDLSGTVNNFTGVIQTAQIQNTGLVRGQTGSLLLPATGSGATMTNLTGTTLAFGNSLTFTDPIVIRPGVVVTLDANTNQSVFTFPSLTIQSGGVIRCLGNVPEINPDAGGSATNPFGQGATIVAGTLTIEPGGQLTADGQGCPYGPGFLTNTVFVGTNAAAGYGGLGGQGAGLTYGSLSNVTALGSGDGSTAGGGALRLIVAGTLTVDGTNSCNAAAPGSARAGASGGSLWIDCGTLQGSGFIMANGGAASTVGRNAGGGGRVFIRYGAKGGTNPLDLDRVSAYGGSSAANRGAAGTILLMDGGSAESNGTLLAVNIALATNTTTLLAADCFPSNPLPLTLDRVVSKNSALELPANRTLAVTTLFSNGLAFVSGTGSTLALVGPTPASIFNHLSTYHFTISNETEKTVWFEAGKTSSVLGQLSLYQARLGSMTEGDWWYLVLDPATGSQRVSRVAVQDSHAGGGAQIVATQSYNRGHNVNWRFNGGLILIR